MLYNGRDSKKINEKQRMESEMEMIQQYLGYKPLRWTGATYSNYTHKISFTSSTKLAQGPQELVSMYLRIQKFKMNLNLAFAA